MLTDRESINRMIAFRLEANVNTYAAYKNEVPSTRPDSHDYEYTNGPYTYHDTYVGGTHFAGLETVCLNGKAVYAMNYMGRVLDSRFSGDFLKEALRAAKKDLPFRGPELYRSGDSTYTCSVTGDITWFTGNETIFLGSEKVYECRFHGGLTE